LLIESARRCRLTQGTEYLVVFSNRDEARRWFASNSREVATLFAARAALRAIPALTSELGRQGRQIGGNRFVGILPILRASSIAWCAAKYPSAISDLRNAAEAAINAPFPESDTSMAALSAMHVVHDKSRRHVDHAIDALNYANAAAEFAGKPYTSADLALSTAAADDARIVEHGILTQAIASHPLWPGGPPHWVRDGWTQLSHALLLANESWEVWTEWYRARLEGGFENGMLELARATMVDKVWGRDPQIVNTHIKRLIGEYTQPVQKTERTPDSEADADPPDALDRSAFRDWLAIKPASWSIAIAARAVLRTVPFQEPVRTKRAAEVTLSVFRAVAISRFIAAYPKRRNKIGADAAEDAIVAAAAAAKDAKGTTSVAAYAAIYAAAAAADVDEPGAAADAAAETAQAATEAAGEGGTAGIALLNGIELDAQALHAYQVTPEQLARMPLWPDEPPWPNAEWGKLSQVLRRLGSHWEVWLNWYDEVMKGTTRTESWEAAFVDFAEMLPWDKGAEAVNTEIAARLARLVPSEGSPAIPGQSPAPVRVEERDGKIAPVGNRDSPFRAAERDFNAWREPVIDHIEELSLGDFREGTNHSRMRDRLVTLGSLLPGDLDEVNERQFRIGYEIERFEGLILAYRSGADDMPALNAAVLEDIDRLHLVLKMGIGKLARWVEFRRNAADDPKHEGGANPHTVAAALDSMAAEMERQPKYFDPQLPATFRFLAEAIKDPLGATRTVVYGGVKSAENLVSFLGQKALGIGKGAVEGVEKHISKAVAAALFLALGDAALTLSGALPQRWTWLKSLIDSLARVSER
jgi:hypothetical protein